MELYSCPRKVLPAYLRFEKRLERETFSCFSADTILYIYIHTFIYVIIALISREPGLYLLRRCPATFSIGNESNGEKRKEIEAQRIFRTFLPDLSVAFPYFVITLKFQSSHCAKMARREEGFQNLIRKFCTIFASIGHTYVLRLI